MKYRWDKKYLYWGLTAFLVLVASISFFLLLSRLPEFSRIINGILDTLKPVIYGLCIAYLLTPVLKYIERLVRAGMHKIKFYQKKSEFSFQRTARVFSVIITCLVTVLFIVGLFSIMLPEVRKALDVFAKLPSYVVALEEWLSKILANNPGLAENITSVFENIWGYIENWVQSDLLPQAQELLKNVTSGVFGAVVALKNIVIGFIVAIYVLASKDLFIAQTKRVCYTILKPSRANSLITVTRKTHRIFGGFITGKLLDSLIIGVLCFICMSIFRWPYPVLISIIIGITNVIPFFGPFIGAVPSAIFILLVDPKSCLYFILFIIVLQQLDGNVIGPKILGDSTGISGFWVLVSLLVGGGLFGFIGMLIGVPTFAVIYTLARELIERTLKRKNLPVNTQDYAVLDHIDINTGETVSFSEPNPKQKRKRSGKNKS